MDQEGSLEFCIHDDPKPDEKGPLAPVMTRPKPPLLPMVSPRLLLLRKRERPRARRSSAALSVAFASSWRAMLSLSASSLRIFLGRKRAAEGARVARAVAPLLTDALAAPSVAALAASVPSVVGAGVSLASTVASLPSVWDLWLAAAAPRRLPRPVALPRTILGAGERIQRYHRGGTC